MEPNMARAYGSAGPNVAVSAKVDSTRKNRRQEEFNNHGAAIRRRADRRSVEWLCRRGGRRLRACWPAGAGGRGGGGSGYWRAGRTAASSVARARGRDALAKKTRMGKFLLDSPL